MKYILCFSLMLAGILASGAVTPNDVEFVFYSREQFNGIRFHLNNDPGLTILSRVFNPRKPTVVLIHGWQDNFEADSNTFVRQAILSKTNANIIKVNWESFAQQGYIGARNAVPGVGRVAGQLLRSVHDNFGYSLKDVTLVGFSLGAHVAGNIGKTVGGQQIGLIIGLDPAGPLISSKDINFSLTPSDADYVQVIHTNAGTLGMRDAVGHADFYPNGGSRQPGCGLDLVGGCAHNRAWEFFAESVTNNHFVAQRCNSWDDFNRNRCNGELRIMGGLSKVDRDARGNFYLATNNASPYGRG